MLKLYYHLNISVEKYKGKSAVGNVYDPAKGAMVHYRAWIFADHFTRNVPACAGKTVCTKRS